MSRAGAAVRRIAPVIGICMGLSGCVAAIEAADMAATNMVQRAVYASTGPAEVHFGMDGDKELPPEPLPSAKRVAVWPDGVRDTLMPNVPAAETLMKSGQVTVVPPGEVSSILAKAQIAPDAKMLTGAEMDTGFADICKATGTDLVIADRVTGPKTEVKAISFSKPTIEYSADLMTYSCQQHAVVWRDQLTLIEHTGGNMPTPDELARIAGQAWANRILLAMGKPASTTTASAKRP